MNTQVIPTLLPLSTATQSLPKVRLMCIIPGGTWVWIVAAFLLLLALCGMNPFLDGEAALIAVVKSHGNWSATGQPT